MRDFITEKNCNTKNIRVAFVLFVLMTIAFFFSFAAYSHAITITGSETITKNSSASYSAAGCDGTVSWGVTGTGASISSNGVLTTGSASCGAITVAASCSDGMTATKWIRVSNAGQWVIVAQCACCFYEAYCGACGITVIEGRYKFWNNVVYSNTPLTPRPDAPSCGNIPSSGCTGCTIYNNCVYGDPPCTFSTYSSASTKWEWQCPSCTNGQTISCYTGPGGTLGVGVCKAGTQTCVNGQWGACQGEITPVAEICGDGKDNNCNGQVDEGCAVCTDGQTKPCAYSGPAGTENVGVCKAGDQTCVNGQWGACEGEVLPTQEICGDNLDNNCDGQVDEGCAVCEVGVRISPSEVAPQKTGGNTQADVVVTLNKPAPPEGCTVRLKVEPIEESGGHNHDGSRNAHVGTLGKYTVVLKEIGPNSIRYTSGEVAGTENIVAVFVDPAGKGTLIGELPINVKVSILGQLGSGAEWRLTGQYGSPGVTSRHFSNHYGEAYTIDATMAIAREYFNLTKTTLGINDMSLEWGGLFDVGNNWSSPHSLHRKGTSVDIDRYVYRVKTKEYILKDCEDDLDLKDIVGDNFGYLLCEPGGKKHIEFTIRDIR